MTFTAPVARPGKRARPDSAFSRPLPVSPIPRPRPTTRPTISPVRRVKKKQGTLLFNFAMRFSIPKDKDKLYAEGLQPKLNELLKDVFQMDKFVYQLEDSHLEKTAIEKMATGQPHNLHFQITGHCKTKHRISQLIDIVNETEFRGMSIKIASNAGKNELRNYCMKKETRVLGPWADHKIYMGADLITPDLFTPDQQALVDFVTTCAPDKRMSTWIYDPNGASGKTAIAKWLCYHFHFPVFTYAKAADILYLVSKFQGKDCYMFNLSKSSPKDIGNSDLYAALEAVKDGMFTSTKYEPMCVLQDPSHVVVFANHLPSLSSLTQGRLRILFWKSLPRSTYEDGEIADEMFKNCIQIDLANLTVNEDGETVLINPVDTVETINEAGYDFNPMNLPDCYRLDAMSLDDSDSPHH